MLRRVWGRLGIVSVFTPLISHLQSLSFTTPPNPPNKPQTPQPPTLTPPELHLLRNLPTHQNLGLGSLLLKWRLKEALNQKKKVYLTASPQGKYLYLKFGFKVIGEVRMRIRDYLNEEEWRVWCEERSQEQREREGVYVQSFMVWDPEEEGWKGREGFVIS